MSYLSDLWNQQYIKKPQVTTDPVPFNSNPIFTPWKTTAAGTEPTPLWAKTAMENPYKSTTATPVATPTVAPVTTSTQTKTGAGTSVDLYAKYRDPKTGKIMTPEEYAVYLGNRVPKQASGDIGQYAGDTLTQGDQSAAALETKARELNNARNDIATGTTDPYGAGNKSGIAYSPTELAAIEKAYAGIYDPVLNDVFTRLKDKQTADAKAEEDKQWKEKQTFATNENIRQWRETTGTKPSSASDVFTQSQLNSGASNAGIGINAFSQLDADLQNFYINPPMADDGTGKSVPLYQNFNEDIAAVKKGVKKVADVTADIMASNLPQAIKTYFIGLLPLTDVEKKGYWATIWGAITGK